jgi:NADH-quinone oxidoreductase subunit E
MAFTFTGEEHHQIARIRARYPDPMSATLPLLHLAQDRLGWVSPEVVDEVARILDLPRIHVADVVSFYTMFRRTPPGRHVISVCRTLSCHVLGGKAILDYLRGRLQLGEAHAGSDPHGRFSLEEVECLAACGTGPTLLVDGVYHESMTVEAVKALLDGLEAGAGTVSSASSSTRSNLDPDSDSDRVRGKDGASSRMAAGEGD